MSTVQSTDKPVSLSPARIIETVMNFRASKVLLVAVSYDIFTHISQGYNNADALSSKIETNKRATHLLLEALCSLGFLEKKDKHFLNSNLCETFLVQGRPQYLGNNLKYQEVIWEAWSDLSYVLKDGQPRKDLREWLTNPAFISDYIQGMANIAKGPAKEIVEILNGKSINSILDVGAGPGAYTVEFLKKIPQAKATLLDLPETLDITKKILKGKPEEPRIQFLSGDYHTLDFGQSQYDLVLMSHITHDEGEEKNQVLFTKAFQALKPGGLIVVHDFMDETGKPITPFNGLFSIHMLVYTEKGKVYSLKTYQRWLRQAGFSKIEDYDIAKESQNTSKIVVGARLPS